MGIRSLLHFSLQSYLLVLASPLNSKNINYQICVFIPIASAINYFGNYIDYPTRWLYSKSKSEVTYTHPIMSTLALKLGQPDAPPPYYTYPFSQWAGLSMELRRGLPSLIHFSLRSTGWINSGVESPTTLFPLVIGLDQFWSGGGGFAPYYTFPFGQRAGLI